MHRSTQQVRATHAKATNMLGNRLTPPRGAPPHHASKAHRHLRMRGSHPNPSGALTCLALHILSRRTRRAHGDDAQPGVRRLDVNRDIRLGRAVPRSGVATIEITHCVVTTSKAATLQDAAVPRAPANSRCSPCWPEVLPVGHPPLQPVPQQRLALRPHLAEQHRIRSRRTSSQPAFRTASWAHRSGHGRGGLGDPLANNARIDGNSPTSGSARALRILLERENHATTRQPSSPNELNLLFASLIVDFLPPPMIFNISSN